MGLVYFLVNAFVPQKGLFFCLDLACAKERKFGQRENRKNWRRRRIFPSENEQSSAGEVGKLDLNPQPGSKL